MSIADGAGTIASTEQSATDWSAESLAPSSVGAAMLPNEAPEDFVESAYLAAFPDVARSIKAGKFGSALHHYTYYGEREGRLSDPRYETLVRADTPGFPGASVDKIYGCKNGQCLIWGWVNDDERVLLSKLVLRNALGLRGSTEAVYRYRRTDVSEALNLPADRNFGFWAIVTLERPETMSAPAELTLSVGAERKTFTHQIRMVDEERFMEIALEHLSMTQAVAYAPVETFRLLDGGLGRSLIALNAEVCRRMGRGAQTVQIGKALTRPEASVIVCLYGKPELLMLQCALYSKCRGIENYEFIYVSNSPEMADLLIKDASIANRIYGMPITLVLLPGNAGFGVANNIAAEVARSDRLLITNPDLFPMDQDWPLHHNRLVDELPLAQTALFGAPLYYDDGSLMHGGMYFEIDVGFSFKNQQATRCEMLRVEHYGKGAPPHTNPYLGSRPVPAISGALMSIDHRWFESLGGFSPEYIYGHYEDADLCLKSFSAGRPAWLHRLPFLHFEGKGSAPRPAHEGGRLVNRWHFTRRWGQIVNESLHGPDSQTSLAPANR
jgi:GT2 family glycosyltransferase